MDIEKRGWFVALAWLGFLLAIFVACVFGGCDAKGEEFFQDFLSLPVVEHPPMAGPVVEIKATSIQIIDHAPDPLNNDSTQSVLVTWKVPTPGQYTVQFGPPTPAVYWGEATVGNWWSGPGTNIHEDEKVVIQTFCVFNNFSCPNGAIFGYTDCAGDDPECYTISLYKAVDGRSQEFFRLVGE